MATATYNATLTTDVTALWRQVQTKVYEGTKLMTEEWKKLDSVRRMENIQYSTRSITVPIDVEEGAGIASVPEGGYEARPSSPQPRELSLNWVTKNGRFTVTKTARWIDQRSRGAMIERQMLYQARKKVHDLGRHVGDYMYGFSTAYLARVDDAGGSLTAGTSHTVPLKDAYGVAAIDNAPFIADKFRKGDYVALIDGGALVTNAIGQITAVTAATPSITVTWNGSADPDDGDYVVKANSLENTTLAGTDYNKGLIGLLDMVTSTSLHGLSGSTYPNWNPAVQDTTGGRMTGVRLHKANQEIGNKGGGVLNEVWIAQGVERDMIALYQAASRYSTTFGMEIDGSIKMKGVTFFSSERVPPGYVFGFDRSSMRKLALLDKPTEQGVLPWDEADKVQDRAMWVFNVDYPCQCVCLNRGNTVYFSGLTEQ